MLKVTNQITSFEEDIQVPEDVIKKLIILSIIWPYEVVRQLFITCIQNKNQYKAIVPVLINLGNLCTLNDQNDCPDTLLVLALKDTLSLENSELIAENMTSIIQFIKSCCLQKEFGHKYPLILTPSSLSDRKLLSVKEVMNNLVLGNLISFFENDSDDYVVLLHFALHILNAFCDTSSTEDWRTIMSKSDLPAFLYCSPEMFLLCLTNILNLRLMDGSEQVLLKLQDWELALNIIKKISTIVQYVMETCIDHFPLIYQFFKETLLEFDWKTQLLWYNTTQYILKRPLKVPVAFFRITGGLNEMFVEDPNDTMVQVPEQIRGWIEVFTACKLSTKITDNLFEQADRWMYNLLLLWNHPYEDTIVRASLEYVLHPKTSLSVSIEYPNLLLHFLDKLYDSFIDVDQAIRDYEGYESQEMIPIIQNLSRFGTRQYFIVLYIIFLLKDNINKSQENEDKQDNYYVSNLIKLLQVQT
ncbi:hypothetical protein BD770DRAFT_246604 [Pilaira anomala]|nr:hypothetical protein BD770DRAFT_246604 [Pilaira anomala]